MMLEIFPGPSRSGRSEHEQCATSLFTCAGRPGRQTQYFLTLRPASAACASDVNVHTRVHVAMHQSMNVCDMIHVTGKKISSTSLYIRFPTYTHTKKENPVNSQSTFLLSAKLSASCRINQLL